jgi:hypothetical protein
MPSEEKTETFVPKILKYQYFFSCRKTIECVPIDSAPIIECGDWKSSRGGVDDGDQANACCDQDGDDWFHL